MRLTARQREAMTVWAYLVGCLAVALALTTWPLFYAFGPCSWLNHLPATDVPGRCLVP